jgi:HEAT repeat protein
MRLNRNRGLWVRDFGLRPAAAFFVAALFVAALFVVSGFSRTLIAQQYTFEQVASGLKHQDAATRLRAIQILKDADYGEAAGPIATALADIEDRVQLAAIDAERSLFTTRVVPRRKRIGLVIEVRTVAGGDAAAAGQLALKPRAVPPELLTGLAVALRDNNPRVRAEAIHLAALLAPFPCARESEPCSQIGNALIDNINLREPALRRAAMLALGQLRYPNAVQALSDQLSFHQKGLDAMAALEGLAGIGHPTSVSTFEDLLASSNADVRRFAVIGLARAGHRDVLARIQDMGQTERSDDVLLAMHYANVKLGGIDASLKQLITGLANASQRSIVLGYLLDLSTSNAPAIAESLTDPSPDVRRLIADIVGFSRNPAVTPALEAATKDTDPDVADAARQAIERLRL